MRGWAASADLVFDPTPAYLQSATLTLIHQDLHLNRAMLSVARHLTWVVLPATGIDFQPQTTRSPLCSLESPTTE